jgi:hypothetical protein
MILLNEDYDKQPSTGSSSYLYRLEGISSTRAEGLRLVVLIKSRERETVKCWGSASMLYTVALIQYVTFATFQSREPLCC